ncbi:hypothetical protein LXT21_39150 [Myxococcus sp. K38C18041901]|uniref:hypothetical protein n=1 Tax=Myxococcus guangdongensis TaxID=2906760 RepID=UPI0020A75747|nr:hypothetical protein [Myxococcus guangdongensis]MCP3064807.1 hypothetical protein [Myxococcus guangdongensis]
MRRQIGGCVVAALFSAACGPATLQLNVRAPPGTNQGRPLYMLVRKVEPKQYATESYDDVSARVVQPGPAVIHSEIIYPGTLLRVPVKVPADSALAVSFLFTAPDGAWQSFIATPLPPSVDIELREGRIQQHGAAEEPPAAPPLASD